ncbi:hypothetical protein KKA95_01500 [Patescibacteria group bacterium]|nr:hypothetical protein [Patescibacteria group bacterium]
MKKLIEYNPIYAIIWPNKNKKMRQHGKFMELFTGRRNIFTVTAIFIGGYFIVYPLVNIAIKEFGYGYTILIGIVVLALGDYILDVFHKE